MVKAYLRYEQAGVFGVVNSDANVVTDRTGTYAISAALENVHVWNLRLGTLHKTLRVEASSDTALAAEVTCLSLDAQRQQVAAGRADGTITVWDFDSSDLRVTLRGHKGAITALQYSPDGSVLASGSQDTNIVVWDTVAETGLYRLRAHKGQVTDLAFVRASSMLLSGSKDGHVRVWDLKTQQCTQIITDVKGEVWCVAATDASGLVAVGTSDSELHLYEVIDAPGANQQSLATASSHVAPSTAAAVAGGTPEVQLVHRGFVRRTATQRALCCGFAPARDGREQLLYCAAAGKLVELYRVRDETETLKHLKRRRKRKRDKQSAAEDGTAEVAATDVDAWTATDKLAALQMVAAKAKLRTCCVLAPSKGFSGNGGSQAVLQLVLGLANNSLQVWTLQDDSSECVRSVELPGHRSDVRAVCLSSDDGVLLSTSNDCVKIWNPMTGACLRTAKSGYGLCAVFAPGNRHAVVGTKTGALEFIDVASGSQVGVIPEAHGTSAIWSITPLPDKSGFVTGGADHRVRVWQWAVEEHPDVEGSRSVSATVARVLELQDDVLCVRVSGNGKLLAVSLLDSTIKVFFLDTFKFFLSLYGHKLPVLAMDISSDSQLLVTGGADKNIRIWGLEFGDCHKSLFAHQDSVMAVAFAPNTHYVFSAGKDKMIKYWDADKFELLLELSGHAGEVWALAMSQDASMLISAGHDRSIRRWERTDEPFFIEEEREKRLETLFEAEVGNERAGIAELDAADEGGDTDGAAAAVAHKSLEALSSADMIVEALDVAVHETNRIQEHAAEAAKKPIGAPRAPFQANPLLLGLSPSAYVLKRVSSVRASDMEAALMVLPFNDALLLLGYLVDWLSAKQQVELCVRVSVLLLRLHMDQLMSTPAARAPMIALRKLLRNRMQDLSDTIGYNVAAMQVLQRMAAEQHGHVGPIRPVKRPLEGVTTVS